MGDAKRGRAGESSEKPSLRRPGIHAPFRLLAAYPGFATVNLMPPPACDAVPFCGRAKGLRLGMVGDERLELPTSSV